MSSRRTALLLAGFLALSSVRARAANALGIPDHDSATLFALLMESLSQGATLANLVATARESVETGTQVLTLLRRGSEAYRAATHLVQDPASIFDERASLLSEAFPELRAFSREAELLRAEFAGETAGTVNMRAVHDFLTTASEIPDSVRILTYLDAAQFGLSERHFLERERASELERNASGLSASIRQGAAAFDQLQWLAKNTEMAAQTAQVAAASLAQLQEQLLLQRIEHAQRRRSEAAAAVWREARVRDAASVVGSQEAVPVFDPLGELE